jgi:colanic acid biosynthesis glycosyl transferase WcaI
VRLGVLQGRGTIGFFERLEKFIYRSSRKIFAIAEAFKGNLRDKGVPEDKIEVVPNFVDTDFIRPLAQANDFSRRNGLTGKYVVLYAGNIDCRRDWK